MLTPFPLLLIFSFFVPTIIRITTAGVFIYLALTHFKHKKTVSAEFKFLGHEVAVWVVGLIILAEFALAGFLFVGAWTQIAALIGGAVFAKMAFFKAQFPAYAPFSKLSYLLLVIMSLTLLLSGAGAFAFDLAL